MQMMTYQFPVTAWRPTAKPSATPATPLDQQEFAETLADALISPKRGQWRKPSTRSAREMLSQLEAQARELLTLAADADKVASFRTFTAYRMFREKLADFQTFCGVIEGQLAKLAGPRRSELEDGFYALWGAIYRPALKAFGGFFAALDRTGVMPLGAREILEGEMLALETMAGLIADPRFAGQHNEELLAETKRLIDLVGSLADRASSLPELVDTRAA
jgi:hypothetical protein